MIAQMRTEQGTKDYFFLDARVKSPRVQEFDEKLATRIVGQENAVRGMSSLYQLFLAGLNQTNRPVGTLLFLGPTGSGIIGSPPGYLGHRETSPLLSQENLDRFKTEETPLSLVLFDEIEKASDALWKLLLGILDKGTLTLGDNRRVDFSQCVIVMTSNLGAREMSGLMSAGIGFAGAQRANSASDGDSNIDEKIYRTAVQAASRNFAPEFMNRIDKVVVFHSLNEQHLRQILDLELCALQERILRSANTKFVFQCSAEVKEMLLREGIDYRYGARHLKRSIERLLVLPISNLVATGQVEVGDSVYVDLDDSGCDVAFSKRHGTPTISDLGVPEGELNPFYGAAVQSQQVGATA